MISSHPTPVPCQWFARLASSLDRRSAPRLALLFFGAVLARGRRTVTAEGPIVLAGDDTVVAHPGPHVYGKARHRDPVRSWHAYTAWRYGHKWVVLAVLVLFPFVARPWAVPVLVDL